MNYIHAAHGMDGTFSNANPVKENWIGGFFGMGGFQIACIANFDQAQVSLYLGNSNTDKNKAAFDYLYSHKVEIEEKLGTGLEWQRNDKAKNSAIVLCLAGVSINNETDWTQMAKFHAEWSKKMYDVMVPYLREWS